MPLSSAKPEHPQNRNECNVSLGKKISILLWKWEGGGVMDKRLIILYPHRPLHLIHPLPHSTTSPKTDWFDTEKGMSYVCLLARLMGSHPSPPFPSIQHQGARKTTCFIFTPVPTQPTTPGFAKCPRGWKTFCMIRENLKTVFTEMRHALY